MMTYGRVETHDEKTILFGFSVLRASWDVIILKGRRADTFVCDKFPALRIGGRLGQDHGSP
jgi:hypothetical protein